MKLLRDRKVLGTILGTILFISCLMYFTYAYYVWRSEDDLDVNLSITDDSGKSTCAIGPDVFVSNIGPVLDYRDGVKANFSVVNNSKIKSIISVVLNVTSISPSLKDESFKYVLLKGDEKIIEGDFEEIDDNSSNVVADNIEVNRGEDFDFTFIVYIDGNVKNDLDVQDGSLISNISVGDCNVAVNHFADNIMKVNAISDENIDFSKTSVESNTNGIYVRKDTKNDKYPIYYYRGNVNNNLIFADTCWKVVRTTETGGLKLIYNGLPNNETCNNTGTSSQISTKEFNKSDISQESLAYVGYMYSNPYISQEKNMYNDTTNYVYGNDVRYDGEHYTLVNTMTSNNWSSLNAGGLGNYHYTCFTTGTTCNEVYYIYNTYNYTDISTAYAWSIKLSNGKKIDDVIEGMLGGNPGVIDTANNISSTIKGSSDMVGTLDYWYYNNIDKNDYGKYVEDTVWCNDRNMLLKGGFNPDGGLVDVTNVYNTGFIFSVYGRSSSYTPSLECSRNVDRFTVGLGYGNGDLTYPVGLLTADEIALAGGVFDPAENSSLVNTSYYLYTGQDYWTMSAAAFYKYNAYLTFVNSQGKIKYNYSSSIMGVRPSISLKPGFKILDDGDGSVSNPYVVK